jgi:hypothetical protein
MNDAQARHAPAPFACSVCGSATTVLLNADMPNSMRSDGFIIAEPLRKYHCFSCGCVAGRNSQPSAPYFRSNGASIFDLNRHRSVATGIERLIESIGFRNPVRVLEVGAASFQTSLQLKAINDTFVITAIEPSPECHQIPGDIEIVINDFLAHRFGAKFSLIFSNHVIEHVSDIRSFLNCCRCNLDDDGVILVCCPTATTVSNELLFADHLFHFTPVGISMCCSEQGHRIRRRRKPGEKGVHRQRVMTRACKPS